MSKNLKFWILILGMLVFIGALLSVTSVNMVLRAKNSEEAQHSATSTVSLSTQVGVQSSY